MSRIEQAWTRRGILACALLPVALFYRLVTAVRRMAYRIGIFKIHQSRLPVVVVGNLSVGGTGKTPLCAHLVGVFQAAGWRPGIVSRGYGGERQELPRLILPTDVPAQVGDEPLMLFQQTQVPVCVCVQRSLAVAHLEQQTDVDIVFADDGLQHLAMARNAEIVVIDGARGFGNGWLLPAGPLREPAAKLHKADIIAVQAAIQVNESLCSSAVSSFHSELANNMFTVKPDGAVALADGKRKPLEDFVGQPVTAMAGIGHPERFFGALRQLGLQVSGVSKPDHHVYTMADMEGHESQPLLVTSKDAVKLRALGPLPVCVFEVPTTLNPSQGLQEKIVQLEINLRAIRGEAASV